MGQRPGVGGRQVTNKHEWEERLEEGLSDSRMHAGFKGPAEESGHRLGVTPVGPVQGSPNLRSGSKVPQGQGPAAPAYSPERRGSNFWPGRARISQDWRMPSPAAMRTPLPRVLVTSSARPWNRGCPATNSPRSQRQPPGAIVHGDQEPARRATPRVPTNCTSLPRPRCPPRTVWANC